MSRRAMRRHISGRGYFGVVVYRPKSTVNIGTLWRSAFVNDAAFLGTVGARYERQPSDTAGTPNHVPLAHYRDFDDLLAHLPRSCPIVGVELDDRAKPLPDFSHPQRALYLLGAEDSGLPRKVLDRCHHVVQIPTAQEWSMNVAVAGSIVMYDRFSKLRRLSPIVTEVNGRECYANNLTDRTATVG